MKTLKKYWTKTFLLLAISGSWSCAEKETIISSGDLTLRVNHQLHTSLQSTKTDAKDLMEGFQPTEYLILSEEKLTNFDLSAYEETSITTTLGEGVRHSFSGKNTATGITKQLVLTVYEAFPNFITTQVRYINESDHPLTYKSWVNNGYHLISQDEPPFWAFQGSSSGARADWIKPVNPGFYQDNYLGMNSSDYGGGIPVTDIWNRSAGIAIGHTATAPKLVSLPTEMKVNERSLRVGVREDFDYPSYLATGDTLQTLETFVMLHSGDYYNGLQQYSEVMQAKGISLPPAEPAAFEPIWCAWGYERDFTLAEVLGTLPKVKALGIKWAVLDDGFQQAEGDWHTNQQKFPGGDEQMKNLVKTIHSHGLKAKLWWAPLAADPGSKLLTNHPDMRLYLEDWAPQYITWWDAYYLSPTHAKTIAHTQEVVDLFLNEWDFDGLKMDGQHMNAVAPDHNPLSGLEDPTLAPEKLPEFFRIIYEHARDIKPDAVVENCPCGTCMSFFNMPHMNQAVSSDPTSSWQIRLKGKTYKALIPQTAYYGDHVELSDGGNDFASSFGVGAVLGTKFTWPADNPTASASYLLTPEKERVWAQWFDLYNQKMLSKETYLGGLYDIGYDLPEAHVIQKGDTLHYAFYAAAWDGPVTLRGLTADTYVINDYFHEVSLGTVTKEAPELKLKFSNFILIEAYPK